jgi:hypothetical protein
MTWPSDLYATLMLVADFAAFLHSICTAIQRISWQNMAGRGIKIEELYLEYGSPVVLNSPLMFTLRYPHRG